MVALAMFAAVPTFPGRLRGKRLPRIQPSIILP
jgi:hypothetical protein